MGKQPQWAPSQTDLQQVFTKHFPYEIVRLVEQYKLLRTPDPDRSEPVKDALIVSFCTHARNILARIMHHAGRFCTSG